MFSLAKLREMLTWRRGVVLTALLAISAVAVAASDEFASSSSRVAKPVYAEGKGDKCVKEESYMRRHHMNELKHHRNETMRKGIRTPQFSLQGCIDCHADKKTNSVLGKDGFCQSCHSYAAVKLDCFECHASKPKANKVIKAMPSQSVQTGTESGIATELQLNTYTETVEPNTTSGASK
ncbi:MAG: hypothetical protein Q8N54_15725 [Sulfurimicrobium sp.]|jgi:hypothetical protein|nr:hypothetical protein [Sulfurimicrobium sp.]MDZ7656689.1 hypothetical protein [Sulfurimicrobium sp.]